MLRKATARTTETRPIRSDLRAQEDEGSPSSSLSSPHSASSFLSLSPEEAAASSLSALKAKRQPVSSSSAPALGPSLSSSSSPDSPSAGSDVIMVSVMKVKEDSVPQFEECIQAVAHEAQEVSGYDCLTVVRPPEGSNVYTSVMKHPSRSKLMDMFNQPEDTRFSKLLALRDSFLVEPIGYQFEPVNALFVDPMDGSTQRFVHNPHVSGVDDHAERPGAPSGASSSSAVAHSSGSSSQHGGLHVQANFIAPREGMRMFAPKYQRNNKKGGHKNLRCFPSCRNGVHFSSGFCGDSIKVHTSFMDSSNSTPSYNPGEKPKFGLFAYGRVFPMDPATMNEDILKSSGPNIRVGSKMTTQEIQNLKRDKDHPQRPWIEGQVKQLSIAAAGGMQTAVFEFNGDCKAWHYGWSAPRGQGQHGQDIYHRFEVVFFQPQADDNNTCVHILRSDPFSIFSSRRASFHQQKDRVGASMHLAAAAAAAAAADSSASLQPPAKRPCLDPSLAYRPAPYQQQYEDIPWADLYSMLGNNGQNPQFQGMAPRHYFPPPSSGAPGAPGMGSLPHPGPAQLPFPHDHMSRHGTHRS